jgi:hypothetical protein
MRNELQKKGIEMKQPSEITLEKEYEKLKTVCKIILTHNPHKSYNYINCR